MFFDVAVNGGLEIDDALEDASLEAPLGEDSEEALDGIEPGCRCRREVEDEARMAPQPFDDLRVLVGGIVVEDDVDDFSGRHLRLDLIEEANEFLMAMPLHALTDD